MVDAEGNFHKQRMMPESGSGKGSSTALDSLLLLCANTTKHTTKDDSGVHESLGSRIGQKARTIVGVVGAQSSKDHHGEGVDNDERDHEPQEDDGESFAADEEVSTARKRHHKPCNDDDVLLHLFELSDLILERDRDTRYWIDLLGDVGDIKSQLDKMEKRLFEMK